MAKYIARVCCTVEIPVDAERIEDVMTICDLNNTDLNTLRHLITEVHDVVEVEEV